jgi:outer membrane protein assembly factor BamB
MSSITIATPYAADGLLYLSSGYVGDKLKALYAIKPGASGDITPPAGETSGEFLAWSSPSIAPYNPTTLVHDGRLYVLYDRGLVLLCYVYVDFEMSSGQGHPACPPPTSSTASATSPSFLIR